MKYPKALLTFSVISITFFSSCKVEDNRIEAENAKLIKGAAIIEDESASGGKLVSLTKTGQGLTFDNLHGANKLAIRYTSQQVGTIGVCVNEQPVKKLNIHSSGAFGGSARARSRRQ